MLQHPTIPRLAMHDDAELSDLIGSAVLSRKTIREWPLSWTQRIELCDGRKFAYKSQLPPLIEPELYTSAMSSLLPDHHILGRRGECSTVLVEWIDSPSLLDLDLDRAELLAHATAVVSQIGEMRGELPAYLDIGTPTKWSAEAELTLGKLRRLIAEEKFTSIASSRVDTIEEWIGTPSVVRTISSSSRVVHRDLKLEHIFFSGEGYRVIDWSVPTIAPGDTDLALLLADAGIDPGSYVDPATCGISHFLDLRWAVVAQHDFFPGPTWDLFEGWALEAIQAIEGTLTHR